MTCRTSLTRGRCPTFEMDGTLEATKIYVGELPNELRAFRTKHPWEDSVSRITISGEKSFCLCNT